MQWFKLRANTKLPARNFKKFAPTSVRGLTVQLNTLLSDEKHQIYDHTISHTSNSNSN